MRPERAVRAIWLLAGLVLLVAALLYNEWLLAPLAREGGFGALTRGKIRAVQAGFALAGLSLLAASEAVRRMEGLARLARHRAVVALSLIGVGLLPVLVVDFALRPFVAPKTRIFARDAALGWRLQPGAEGEWGDVFVRINAQGLRGPEVALPKPPGVRRLLFLGDSVTFGYGVEDAASVFPWRVGSALADALEEPVEVVNAGVGGWSPWQELAWLESDGLRYAPDLLVVGFVLNDVTEPLSLVRYGGTGEGWQLARTARSTLDHWLSASALATAAREGVAVLRFGRDVRLGAQARETADVLALASGEGGPGLERAWSIALSALGGIVDVAEREEIPLLLVVFPYRFQLDAPRALAGPQARVLAFAAERGVPALDLLPRLASAGAETFLDPSHLSPAGHALAADAIAARVLAEGWLAGPGRKERAR
jgi:lysophospholipase L1-like esterase